jgi:hypothetical protein
MDWDQFDKENEKLEKILMTENKTVKLNYLENNINI